MGHRPDHEQFARLFKRFRLRAEIQTLAEFGNLLSEEGFVVESSLYSRWQMGKRVPRDRALLLKILEVFAKRQGIATLEEANEFLAAVRQRDLSSDELLNFEEYFQSRVRFNVPDKTSIFIGREQISKDITWHMLNKKKIAICGVPGVGKTALAIQIGHILKDRFAHGVYFYRVDIKSLPSVIDDVLQGIGYDIAPSADNETKLSKLREGALKKNFCLILDNVEKHHTSQKLFQYMLDLPVPILLTSISPIADNRLIVEKLESFSPDEFEDLCVELLGKPFVIQNKRYLQEMGEVLGFLPIASVIILKQILANPLSVKNYIARIKRNSLHLKELSYDNKDLFSSIEFSFNNLEEIEKNVLLSCSLFEGVDFDLESVAYVNNISTKQLRVIFSTLVTLSLMEISLRGRYRLHPVIKLFINTNHHRFDYLRRLVSYYKKTLDKRSSGRKSFFNQEIDNIIGLVTLCSEQKKYAHSIALWSKISVDLWYLGLWNYITDIRKHMINAYREMNDYFGLVQYMSEDLCRIYFYTHNRAKESYYLKASLKQAKQLNDSVIMGLVQQKSGFISLDKGNLLTAQEKLEESIKLLSDKGPKKDLIKSYIYLGKTFTKLGQHDKARAYLILALKKSQKYKILEDIGLSQIFLGDLYSEMNLYEASEREYQKGLKVENKIGRKLVIALGYYGLGQVNQSLVQPGTALRYYNKAMVLFKELGMKKEEKKLTSEIELLLKH